MSLYLEFAEIADFIAHLREQCVHEVCTEITTTSGKATGEFQVAGVAYHAAITANLGNYVAATSELLGRTTSMHLSVAQERDEIVQTMLTRFAEVQDSLRQQGFTVQRGVWRLDAPFFLKG